MASFTPKVAAVSFVVGAAFESVMLATDFLPKGAGDRS
jgi:hypothetical protein